MRLLSFASLFINQIPLMSSLIYGNKARPAITPQIFWFSENVHFYLIFLIGWCEYCRDLELPFLPHPLFQLHKLHNKKHNGASDQKPKTSQRSSCSTTSGHSRYPQSLRSVSLPPLYLLKSEHLWGAGFKFTNNQWIVLTKRFVAQ